MDQQPLVGKTALVTGATGGIGKHIALGLARLGATVLVGARDAAKGDATRAEIVAASGNPRVDVVPLDVASVASVRALGPVVGRRTDRLDILVNNAGAWFSDRRVSVDGIELTFATNVLGPHLVTTLLAPQLAASPAARIVNVVSGLAANYDSTDVEFERRKYDGFKVYAASKQALRMLTWGQAARYAGTSITANAAAPGFVRTDFNQHAHGFMAAMIGASVKLFGVSAEKGADTPLWVATAPELAGVTGKYFDKRKDKDGKFRDPVAIAELEQHCELLAARPRRAA